MALAHVVYHISTDADFASQMKNDPEGALAKRGLKLNREELAFLIKGLRRDLQSPGENVSLADIKGASWY